MMIGLVMYNEFNFDLDRMKRVVESKSYIVPNTINTIHEFNEWIDNLNKINTIKENMKTFKEFRDEVYKLTESEEYKKAVEPDKSEQELEKAAKIAAESEGEHIFGDEHKFYAALGLPDDFGVHKENFQEYKDLWQSVVDKTNEDDVLDILKKHFK